jgi:hypothetical protein
MLDRRILMAALVCVTLAAERAHAQEPAQDGALELQDEPAAPEPEPEVAVVRDDSFGIERTEPQEGRWYVGGFYRHTWTPAFLLKPFLQEVTSTSNHGAGFEAMYSRRHLDISIHGFWQGYRTYGTFLADGDPTTDTEMIDSSLSQAGAGVNFLWTAELTEKFAFQYGLDLGLGYVLGQLRRTEAYPTTDRNVDGYRAGWAPCQGPGDPAGFDAYCEGPSVPDGEEGGHYNVVTRRWTSGGSVPNVWFRFGPHLALRYNPFPAVRIRVDGGFDLFSGFFAGGLVALRL